MNATMKPIFPDTNLLVRELTHRVNNEFTSALGMLAVAAARCADSEAQSVLGSVQRHLEDYARIHRALQMPEPGILCDAADYLAELCQSVSRSKLESRGIRLVMSVQPMSLSSERCWLLGMIVNELITNAMRHAFHDEGGVIRVSLCERKSAALCIVSDNGTKSVVTGRTGGLRIVKALAESLDAAFSQRFGSCGSMSLITFPAGAADANSA